MRRSCSEGGGAGAGARAGVRGQWAGGGAHLRRLHAKFMTFACIDTGRLRNMAANCTTAIFIFGMEEGAQQAHLGMQMLRLAIACFANLNMGPTLSHIRKDIIQNQFPKTA